MSRDRGSTISATPGRSNIAQLFLVIFALGVSAAATQNPPDTDWKVTTGDQGSRRYSPLDQIDRDNVAKLEVAWRWSSPDNRLVAGDGRFESARMRPGSHEVTPLKVGDRLYVTTGLSQLAAIDAATGETVWTFDPEAYVHGRPTNLGFVHRGASYWADPAAPRSPGRLFYASGDAFLRAIDASTGEPVGAFGDRGQVDLVAGLRRPVDRRRYTVSSPVMLCGDVVVVGSSISDGPTEPTAPPGDVRGFDARTGALRWTFHSVAQPGELGDDTWRDGAAEYTGNTNVWTLMSADDELGLVYLPFGTPTNDWYGGHRLGDGLFAESLVAVDCKTGERRWHFQAIHHGLWDYDLVTSPILGDIRVDGRELGIAAQLSKQGFVYVFDRATGEPVWPIVERPVPPSKVEGEYASPTQPFPTKPPPFERQGLTEADLIAFTPELLAEAKEIVARYDYGPLYTPPSERQTINVPGWAGGASWPGGAFDPETGFLYVPSFTLPVAMTLQRPDASRSSFRFVGSIERRVKGPRGLPLLKPPYSRVTAYDLNRGDIAWVTPIGDGPIHHPALRDLGLGPLGSGARSHVLVTKTLLFVTTGESLYGDEEEAPERPLELTDASLAQLDGANGDAAENSSAQVTPRREPAALRVLDKRTGEVLWKHDFAVTSDGSPITYRHQGIQYLVVALGGRQQPAELIAFRLPAEP